MASAASAILGPLLRSGLVVAPGQGLVPAPLELVVAEHPHPGEGSIRAGREALSLARQTATDERLLVLLSGGASALLAAPAAGLTLEDKRQTSAQLLRAGASIHELNTVRKQLSAIKGGRLALASPSVVHTLALSDVVGDDLSVIGSGPTVADRSTRADAVAVLKRFGGAAEYPAPVLAFLGQAEDETAAEAARAYAVGRGDTARILGGRREAMQGAAGQARAFGYRAAVLEEPVVGEARAAGKAVIETALAVGRGARPCCVISSGETTVTVNGSGRGGRNQELALAAVDGLAAEPGVALASIGTDGIDGPTDAAGALADSSTASRAAAAGLAPEAFLRENDAYHFFAALGDLVITGPTGTNVGDLQVVLLA